MLQPCPLNSNPNYIGTHLLLLFRKARSGLLHRKWAMGTVFSPASITHDMDTWSVSRDPITVIKFGHMSFDVLAYGAPYGTLTVCTVSESPSVMILTDLNKKRLELLVESFNPSRAVQLESEPSIELQLESGHSVKTAIPEVANSFVNLHWNQDLQSNLQSTG
ncbi:hypothetical protein L1887_15065 [Cichorium endivia]|nr:hypothetical protein L1887_15065 [Cichorium endivia]